MDGIVKRQPCIPPFTTDGVLDYAIELVVSEDSALQLIDKAPFHRLLRYLRPSLSEQDIPHRMKLRKEVLARAQQAEAQVKAALQVRS